MAATYRAVLRELRASAVAPGKLNPAIIAGFRSIISAEADIQNALIFMRSQRVYNELLEQYNPTINYTEDERIKATGRRVGVELPRTYDPNSA
uniref:Complex 1 LYR protein n=1 Tax=Mycena chlorophos TaxID=658473 RepID=A0ABQ0LSP8_MYCCL|nr:predicted protein [Mycena chlorophos]